MQASAAVQSSPLERPALLCFGDSITAHGRWVSAPEAAGPWRLVNAGRAGRKTSDIVAELPPALADHSEASGLLLLLGVNDLPARDPRPGDEKIADCVVNLRAALDLALTRFPRESIFLVAPSSVDVTGMDALTLSKGYDITPPLLARLERELELLAREKGVRFFSLHGLLGPGHFSDGLHPNAAGDAIIARAVGAALGLDAPPSCAATPLPAFYLVGDSISIDYHEDLERECAGRFHYTRKGGLELARSNLDHPQGANGGDSASVLTHLREVLAEERDLQSMIVVNCGLHDIKTDPATGARQVPLEDYRRNLEAMVELVQGAGRRLVWILTTPVDERRHNARSRAFHRFERDVAAYNTAAREIMSERGVPVIDLHAFTLGLGGDPYRDHVHFTSEISRRQARFVREALDALSKRGGG